jgi:hypothetical protein
MLRRRDPETRKARKLRRLLKKHPILKAPLVYLGEVKPGTRPKFKYKTMISSSSTVRVEVVDQGGQKSSTDVTFLKKVLSQDGIYPFPLSLDAPFYPNQSTHSLAEANKCYVLVAKTWAKYWTRKADNLRSTRPLFTLGRWCALGHTRVGIDKSYLAGK